MTINEYAELAQRTASTKTKEEKIGHGCLGLIGEAGEIVDIVKKMEYMGMTMDIAIPKLVDELSDVYWYIVEWCKGVELDVEDLYREAVYGSYGPAYGEDDFKPSETLEELAFLLAAYCCDLYDICLYDGEGYGTDAEEGFKSTILNSRRRFERYVDVVFRAIICYTSCMIRLIGRKDEDIWQHNIDKLSKRYPEHIFNADRSNQRYV